METVEPSQQQSLRIAELPEDYRVIGGDGSAPFVRKPNGEIVRIQQNGRPTAATTEEECRLAEGRADAGLLADGVQVMTPYTNVSG